MPISTPRDKLLAQGDLLERHMFANNEFSSAFDLYPKVWADFVFPNRKPSDATLVVDSWLRFAERHYSTIIRCWNAWSCKASINRICTQAISNCTPENYLEVHERLAAFFCILGAAIENLRECFAVDPIGSDAEFNKRWDRPIDGMSLKWIYGRRTQYVHKVIVPVADANGLLSFDEHILHDTETRWDSSKQAKLVSVSDFVDEVWTGFQQNSQPMWSVLLDCLKDAVLLAQSTSGTTQPPRFDTGQFQETPLQTAMEGPGASGTGLNYGKSNRESNID